MKTLLAKSPFEFRYEERPIPQPLTGQVLVKMEACGICATDFSNVKYNFGAFTAIGHEGAGEVIEKGEDVTGLTRGDRVAISGMPACGECDLCKKHKQRLCRNGPSVWNSKQMLFSEFAVVDRRLLYPFKMIDYPAAALLEPAGVAMELVKVSEIEKGEAVLIIGLGAIGLMAASIALSEGARVYGAELSFATAGLSSAEKLGLEGVVMTDMESILPICSKNKISRIMITAPPATIPQAAEAIEFGGLITFIGLGHGGDEVISLNGNKFLRKKATLKAVYVVPSLYPDEAMRALESNAIDSELIITHTFKFDDIEKAFEVLETEKGKALKVMITF